MKARSRAIAAGGLTAVAVILLAGAATTGWLSTASEGYVRGLLLAGSVTCVAIAMILNLGRTTTEPRTPHIGVTQFKPDWILDLQQHITKSHFDHDARAVISFIDLITQPAHPRSRVVEALGMDGRLITQRVSVEFVIPGGAIDSNVLYLPISLPRKGELIDNFDLTDETGSTITNLSYDETTRLVAVGLRTMLLSFTRRAYADWRSTRLAEFVLLGLITERGPAHKEIQESRIDRALTLVERPITPEAAALVRSYVKSLSTAYPIVAVVPRDHAVANRILLRLDQTIRPAAATDGRVGSIRLSFKLKPREVHVPLDLSLTTGSYHLRIKGPSDKYLYEQHVRCRSCKKRIDKSWRGVARYGKGCYHESVTASEEDCHFHIQPRSGQNYLHLYMRGYAYSRTPIRNLEATAVFKETPPGTRATATITALATTLFIWTSGYLVSHREIIPNSDLPALLLALPAIAASWFGFSADGDSLVGSSLLARISLAVSGLLSIAAIITYLIQVPGLAELVTQVTNSASIAHHSTGRRVREFAGLDNVAWIILFSLSTVNSVYILWRFVKKLRYYAKLTSRKDIMEHGYSST